MNRVFLTGAGISYNLPSNLPLANTIITELLKILVPQKDILEDIENLQKTKRNEGDYVRFESLMQQIQLIFDSKFEIIDFIALYKNPNRLHYIISESIIKDDVIVLTTNFDALLEEAILKLGYEPYTICYKNDFSNYQKIKYQGFIPVIKLHGSYFKYIGKRIINSKSTIQATIDRVTADNDGTLLDAYKYNFLVDIADSSELTVVGYSGGDDFDIVPSLQEIQFKKIQWIFHSDAESDITNKYIEKLSTQNVLSPRDELFKHYYTNKNLELTLLNSNTLEYLKEKFNNRKDYEIADVDANSIFSDFIKTWKSRKNITELKQYRFVSEIYNLLSRFEKALEYLEKASFYSNSKSNKIKIDIRKTTFLNALSKYDEAETIIKKILKEKQFDILSNSDKAKLYKNYGYLLYRNRKLKNARLYTQKAMDLTRQTDITHCQAKQNMGLIYLDGQEYKKAQETFSTNLLICEKMGYTEDACSALQMLGDIYLKLGNFSEALEHFKKSLNKSILINNFVMVSYNTHSLSTIEFLNGNVFEALCGFRKSLWIDIQNKSTLYKSVSFLHIGLCYMELERNNMADYCFSKACYHLKKHQNEEVEIELLYYYALLKSKNNDIEAIAIIDKALTIKTNNSEFTLLAEGISILIRYKFLSTSINFQQIDKIIYELNNLNLQSCLMDIVYVIASFNIAYNPSDIEIVRKCALKYKEIGNYYRLAIIN